MAMNFEHGDEKPKRRDMFLVDPRLVLAVPAENPRSYQHTEEHIAWLADSMHTDGQGQPIEVRVMPDKSLKLVAGWGRHSAGIHIIENIDPEFRLMAIVTKKNDSEAYLSSLNENLVRKDLSVMEEALAVRRLVEHYGMTHSEIAKKWHRSGANISQRAKLLFLCEEARLAVHEGRIQVSTALDLADLNEEQQKEFLADLLAEKRIHRGRKSTPAPEQPEADPETPEAVPETPTPKAGPEPPKEPVIDRLRRAAGKNQRRTIGEVAENIGCLQSEAVSFFPEDCPLREMVAELFKYTKGDGAYEAVYESMKQVASALGTDVREMA